MLLVDKTWLILLQQERRKKKDYKGRERERQYLPSELPMQIFI
jgi:hypothetical protein